MFRRKPRSHHKYSTLSFESLEKRDLMASDLSYGPVDNFLPVGAVNQLYENYNVVAGDFDKNGLSDVLYVHKETGYNRLVRNLGNGQFSSRDDFLPRGSVNHLRDQYFALAGDFDRNGYCDFLYIHKETGYNRLVRNLGLGQFSNRDNFLPQSSVNHLRDQYFVLAGDFDNNAHCDFLYIHKETGYNRLVRNLGLGQFSNRDNFLPQSSVNHLRDQYFVLAGDFRSNGFCDVLYVHKETGYNRLVQNHGNGQFSNRDDRLPQGAVNHLYNSHYTVAGNFDRDGDSDLIYIHKETGANRLTPTGGFQIMLNMSGFTASQQAILYQAADRWEQVIVGDLPDITYRDNVVDDLLIDASVIDVPDEDGKNNLGQARPDVYWANRLPVHGIMQLDSDDMAAMEQQGTLFSVVMHEIGHVLGIGSLWQYFGLLVGAGTTNPVFIGAQATAAYNQIFGTSARGVPAENEGREGTRDAHFREDILRTELMTSAIGRTAPLSRITIGSLADIGYNVNYAAADAYARPGSFLAMAATLPNEPSSVAFLHEATAGLPAPVGLANLGSVTTIVPDLRNVSRSHRALDRVMATAGHDVLVAGSVALHLMRDDLLLIAQEWAANRTEDNSTSGEVIDEVLGGFDMLTGSSGADWFIATLNDKVTDFKKQNKDGDVLTTV